jgi:general secretion pathway protein F
MQYRYEAYDGSGRAVRGILDAANETEALGRLNGQGLMPFELSSASGADAAASWLTMELGRRVPSLAERARMMRQLATLLSAGIVIDRALRLLELQAPSQRTKRLAVSAADEVAEGKSLSAALARPGSGFAADEIGLIKAGEQAGALVPVLEDLSAMLEKRVELRGRLISALVYPAVLIVMALISLTVIATVLVPNIAPIFDQSGAPMPFILWLMTGLSALVTERGRELAIGVLLVLLLAIMIFRQPAVRRGLESLALRLPVIGSLIRLRESARICRTLGALLRGGAALQSAIAATGEAARGRLTRSQLASAIENVTGGRKLADALSGVHVLDGTARQMIAIGEETNRLDTMLLHVASGNELEAAARIERLMTLLTPLLTVALGLLVGGLIMSVMRAILSVNELAVS